MKSLIFGIFVALLIPSVYFLGTSSPPPKIAISSTTSVQSVPVVSTGPFTDCGNGSVSFKVKLSGTMGAGTWPAHHMLPDGPMQILGPHNPLAGEGRVALIPLQQSYIVNLISGTTVIAVRIQLDLSMPDETYYLWSATAAIADISNNVPNGGAYINTLIPFKAITQPDGSVKLIMSHVLYGNADYDAGKTLTVEVDL